MISSKLRFPKGDGISKDAMTTVAIDRLVHRCVILDLNIPNRVEQAKKAKEEKAGVTSRSPVEMPVRAKQGNQR